MRLLLAAGIVALAAFCVLALAGLPILGRYLFFPRRPARDPLRGRRVRLAGPPEEPRVADGGDRHRRWRPSRSQIPFIPAQVDRIRKLGGALGIQTEIRDDLRDMASEPPLENGCQPLAVPNHRPVPLLALWLDRAPEDILSAQLDPVAHGQYLDPATERVLRNFTLDKRDPKRLTAQVPPGFRRVAANRSWILYERCGAQLPQRAVNAALGGRQGLVEDLGDLRDAQVGAEAQPTASRSSALNSASARPSRRAGGPPPAGRSPRPAAPRAQRPLPGGGPAGVVAQDI